MELNTFHKVLILVSKILVRKGCFSVFLILWQLVESLYHDSSFPAIPMVLKILMNEVERNSDRTATISYKIFEANSSFHVK